MDIIKCKEKKLFKSVVLNIIIKDKSLVFLAVDGNMNFLSFLDLCACYS